jgi:hypothetical protein
MAAGEFPINSFIEFMADLLPELQQGGLGLCQFPYRKEDPPKAQKAQAGMGGKDSRIQ